MLLYSKGVCVNLFIYFISTSIVQAETQSYMCATLHHFIVGKVTPYSQYNLCMKLRGSNSLHQKWDKYGGELTFYFQFFTIDTDSISYDLHLKHHASSHPGVAGSENTSQTNHAEIRKITILGIVPGP